MCGNASPVTSKHSQSYLQLLAASAEPKADSIVTLKAYRQDTVRESIFTHNTSLIQVALYPWFVENSSNCASSPTGLVPVVCLREPQASLAGDEITETLPRRCS